VSAARRTRAGRSYGERFVQTEILSAGGSGLQRAAELLGAGQLVAFPTDTVYGVGAPVFDANAVASIYVAKERPPEKAIPVLMADGSDLPRIASTVPDCARVLMAHFWPGGLTLVLPKRPDVPAIVSSDLTVAVRIPDLALARALMRLTGPLAATSANRSGQLSPVTAAEVTAQLGGCIAAVLDGGPCPGGVPSTVVDCTASPPRVLRQGALSLDILHAAIPHLAA
jgi:L-threonylcarbamoyladenylate synthase